MKTKDKYIVSGGGTGGHIYPALAIAEILQNEYDAEILFVGATGKMEMEKVPHAGFKIKGLPIRGFQRGSIIKNISLPFRLIWSLVLSFFLLLKQKPKAVIGTGGYASAPLVIMASLLKIPVYLQEQNSFPGMVNRKMVRFANKIFVAYPNMNRFFPSSKIVETGNPIRSVIIENFKKVENTTQNKKVCLVLGGSLGARAINNFFIDNIKTIKEEDFDVVWQCGASYYEKCKEELEKNGNPKNIKLFAFIKDMATEYSKATIVVCRSGALTVSEIALVNKPTIFIPSPNVTDNHQYHNAKSIADYKACKLVAEKDLDSFYPTMVDFLKNESLQNNIKENLQQFSRPEASKDIVTIIQNNG